MSIRLRAAAVSMLLAALVACGVSPVESLRRAPEADSILFELDVIKIIAPDLLHRAVIREKVKLI